MSHGGSRPGSGPAPDPTSGRSAARGLEFTALPAQGYQGDIPAFPLDLLEVRNGAEVDFEASANFNSREAVVWTEAWRTPQAAAWALESWRWPIIAEYCRLKVTIELEPGANAALVGHLHRYREQIGLTSTGMTKNGWQIARDEVGERRTKKSSSSAPGKQLTARERRLKAVGDGS